MNIKSRIKRLEEKIDPKSVVEFINCQDFPSNEALHAAMDEIEKKNHQKGIKTIFFIDDITILD